MDTKCLLVNVRQTTEDAGYNNSISSFKKHASHIKIVTQQYCKS